MTACEALFSFRRYPPSAMQVAMLLADHAQAVQGKLYIVGGGWTIIAPGTPSAVAIYIRVPWTQTNTKHTWRLELIDSDGQPVVVPGPVGEQPIVIEGGFEVGRPAGSIPGTEQAVSLAVNYGPLPLAPGGRYEWRLAIDGHPDDDWRLPFSVVALPVQNQPPPEAS